MGEHSVIGILGPICATIAFIVTAAFNALSAQQNNLGIYTQSTTLVSAKFDLAVTPAGWTFSIWGVIYFWQAALLLYSFTLICRRLPKSPGDGYLYMDPCVIPPSFFFVYVINMGFNIGWTLLFDREMISVALGFIVMIPFTLFICMLLALRQLSRAGHVLEACGATKEIWFHRVIVQNGIGIYATWTSVASLLNVAMVMQYKGDVARSTSAWVALAILTFEVILFFSADVFFLDQHTRYLTTPYAVLVVALSGVVYRNWDTDRDTSSYAVGLLSLSALLLVVKVIVIAYRTVKRPIVYGPVGSRGEKSAGIPM